MMKHALACVALVFLILFNTMMVQGHLNTKHEQAQLSSPEGVYTVNLSTPPGTTLIPYGAMPGVNDIDEIVHAFTVDVDAGTGITPESVQLTITTDDEDFVDDGDLFTVIVDVNLIETDDDTSTAEVVVRVRLKPPSGPDAYARLTGQSFGLRLDVNIK